MRIMKDAVAGTLESSDLMVKVSPQEEGELEVVIASSVLAQFGKQIRAVVDETLAKMNLTQGQVVVEDKGALDYTIRARVQAAVLRGCDEGPEAIDWSTL